MLSERRGAYAPFGLAGGEEGAIGRNRLRRAVQESENLGGKFAIEVAPGDRLTIETPGGGGFGEASLPAEVGYASNIIVSGALESGES